MWFKTSLHRGAILQFNVTNPECHVKRRQWRTDDERTFTKKKNEMREREKKTPPIYHGGNHNTK